VQLHAPCVEPVLRHAVLVDANVAGRDSNHGAVVAVDDFRGRERRVNLDGQLLGLLAQPGAHLAEADDMVAVVVQRRRRGQREGPALREVEQRVVARLLARRRTLLLPVGDQLVERARLEDVAREDVRADRRALLEQADRELLAALFAKLAQPDGRGEPSRPSAHDDHVVMHHLPLLRHHLELLLGELRRGRASAHVPRAVVVQRCSPDLAAERPSGGRLAAPPQPAPASWAAQGGGACCCRGAQHPHSTAQQCPCW
jgi:hypothetical protein